MVANRKTWGKANVYYEGRQSLRDVLGNDLCLPLSFWKPTSSNSYGLRESLSRPHGTDVSWNSLFCIIGYKWISCVTWEQLKVRAHPA